MRKLLFAASLAFTVFALPISATAQNVGVQYNQMPVGTTAYYQHTDGRKWVDIYKGVKRGLHVVERFKGHKKSSGRPEQTQYFDKSGRLLNYRAYGDRAKPYKIAY
ncbi:hypothetical protein N9Z87_01960, partial [Amylibacter sp.]|nr:hypothetical protein [Amylibacter sp.]